MVLLLLPSILRFPVNTVRQLATITASVDVTMLSWMAELQLITPNDDVTFPHQEPETTNSSKLSL